ncbi:MAG: IPExxxVDY family protein [Bacteroidetes bacterium]|nr:MAG: IPExxxVDY family protein [Bacteroidota bacterium]
MKLKLDNDGLENDFFDDARLLGIVAPLKGYQFCWQLNNQLRFNFRINNQIEIQLAKKQRKYFFCVYECTQSNSALIHYLYHNQFDGEYLLPEFKYLDFLWLLKGDEVPDQMLSELMQTVRNINGVQLVTELKSELIKNKAHLIF